MFNISQLINCISSVLQKLHRYFSGTHISLIILTLLPALPIIFFLYLKKRLVSSLTGKSMILSLFSKAG